MKTLHDYMNIMCGGYSSPLYTIKAKITKAKSICEFPHLTTCGHMVYISFDMLLGGEY